METVTPNLAPTIHTQDRYVFSCQDLVNRSTLTAPDGCYIRNGTSTWMRRRRLMAATRKLHLGLAAPCTSSAPRSRDHHQQRDASQRHDTYAWMNFLAVHKTPLSLTCPTTGSSKWLAIRSIVCITLRTGRWRIGSGGLSCSLS